MSPVRDSESTTRSLLAAFPPPRLPFYHSRQPSYAQSNGVGVDNAEQNSQGSEVIEVAASGNALTDQAFLSANSYINYTDENGCTPLLCCKKGTFCYCGAAHCCSLQHRPCIDNKCKYADFHYCCRKWARCCRSTAYRGPMQRQSCKDRWGDAVSEGSYEGAQGCGEHAHTMPAVLPGVQMMTHAGTTRLLPLPSGAGVYDPTIPECLISVAQLLAVGYHIIFR
jgi:hypothetical protein